MAPERAGALPARGVVELCLGGTHTRREVELLLAGRGGLVAHLGTNSLLEVEQRLAEPAVREVFDAFAYGIAKAITGSFAALAGPPDAIVLTGGGCRCEPLLESIRERVGNASPLLVYPENLEMAALAEGALRVLQDGEEAREY